MRSYTSEDMSSAIQAFESIVGRRWVYTSTVSRDMYRDAFSPYYGTERSAEPAAAVAPENTDQVQKVVGICNRYRIPFWVVSTGKNLGYGGSAPLSSDMITIDLKRMNRILEVNEKLAYAVVEPGVSFLDLYRYIQKKGIKLWLDVPSPGWGSVIANSLEHGTGYAARPEHVDNLCGMEVVLPTGEVLRTGMGAMENPSLWHTFKLGLGPSLDGLFGQTSMGIVTRAGVRLQPEPQSFISVTTKVKEYGDLIPLVDLTTKMRLSGTIPGVTSIRSGYSELIYDQNIDTDVLFNRNSPANMAKLGYEVVKRGLKQWHAHTGLFGSKRIAQARLEELQDTYSSISGCEFEVQHYTPPFSDPKSLKPLIKLSAGIPTLGDWIPVRTSEGLLLASPMIPATGEAALEAYELAKSVHDEYGVMFGGEFLTRNGPEIMFITGTKLSKSDLEANERAIAMYKQMYKAFVEKGWGEMRAHNLLMDTVMDQFSWNDYILRRTHQKIKHALDPHGVMAPGKNGIFPLGEEEKNA